MRKHIVALMTFASVTAMAGGALAADLYSPPPAVDTPIYAPVSVYNWTGFYAGVSGGWSWGQSNSDNTPFSMPINGGVLGAQAGYNYMFSNNVVLGLEGDISWTGQKGSVDGLPTVTQKLDWLGTARARLGYAMNNWMPYVTGGFAFGNGTRTSSIGPSSETQMHTGYVLGAGIEWAFAQNWTAKLEYQYVNLGRKTYNDIPADPHVNMTDSIVKVGVNYKF